jgi:ubiquinone/menaquinone biosynthesis C-methylase UbiE
MGHLTKPIKERIRSLLELGPGQRVLDVGCGSGVDSASVLAEVQPGGLVVGIDCDGSMIRRARDHTRVRRHLSRALHLFADADCIPYLDATFDRCYSGRVLQHATEPATVISELVRVTKPAGTIVIAETDWATLSIDTPATATERELVRFVGDSLGSGYAGRQLRRMLSDQGLTDVHVEMWPVVWTDYGAFRATSLSLLGVGQRAVKAGVLSSAALAHFHQTLADADARGAFFATSSIVVARGRKGADRVRSTAVCEIPGHLHAELPEMMIGMEVGPSQPR